MRMAARAVSLLILSLPPIALGGEATLYRDTWGVPHIHADKLTDAAYAMGHAQAEDRLADIYQNVRTATGRMAEVFGEEHVETDYAIRMMRNAELCQDFAAEQAKFISQIQSTKSTQHFVSSLVFNIIVLPAYF